MVTTRIPQVAKSLNAKILPLQKLSRENSLILFNRFRQYDSAADDSKEDKEDLEFVLQELDGLALGIKQVATFTHDAQWTLKKFREKYLSMASQVLSQGDTAKHTLANAWNVQFEELKEREPRAHYMLGILSLLNADSIPIDILSAAAPMPEGPYEFFEDEDEYDISSESECQC